MPTLERVTPVRKTYIKPNMPSLTNQTRRQMLEFVEHWKESGCEFVLRIDREGRSWVAVYQTDALDGKRVGRAFAMVFLIQESRSRTLNSVGREALYEVIFP